MPFRLPFIQKKNSDKTVIPGGKIFCWRPLLQLWRSERLAHCAAQHSSARIGGSSSDEKLAKSETYTAAATTINSHCVGKFYTWNSLTFFSMYNSLNFRPTTGQRTTTAQRTQQRTCNRVICLFPHRGILGVPMSDWLGRGLCCCLWANPTDVLLPPAFKNQVWAWIPYNTKRAIYNIK